MIGAPLTPADLTALKQVGIDEHTVSLAGLRRVTHVEARDACGLRYRSDHLEGIAIPHRDPRDESRVLGYCVRRDHPEVDSDGRPIGKYLSSPDRRHLYFGPDSFNTLADATVPAILVEAAKSVLSIVAAESGPANRRHGLILGLGGCWGGRGVVGKATAPDGTRVDEKGWLPDFDLVTWTGRDTIIVLDANVTTNEKVQAARRALAAELTRRGARVRVVDLPAEPGVNGPDDYIGKHGGPAFFALVDAAQPLPAPGKAAKTKSEKPKQGQAVTLDDPEPWPDPVDGAALLTGMVETFRRYLALPAHAPIALALWVLHVYAFEAFFATPFLAITSPAKRCGKTMLLIVTGALVPRRMFASNVTPAVLFRAIEKFRPTLLIDEADTFVRDNEELRGVLNSGHTRTTATVIRAVGDDHDPRAFSTWCPKAIALIGTLPGTLDDRSIEVRMRRRTAGEQVERLRQDRIEAECLPLRRMAARWADDHLDALRHADPAVPPALHDRAADCWRPLLAIADAIGGNWPAHARDAALALTGADAEDDSATMLLSDIRTIFDEEDAEVLGSTTILEKLTGLEDRPWRTYGKHEKPLTGAKLAWLLKRYDVLPAGTVRIGPKTVKGYRRLAFDDAWRRYLPAPDVSDQVARVALPPVETSHHNNANESGALLPLTKGNTPIACDASSSVTTPIPTEQSDGVTDRHPRKRHTEDLPKRSEVLRVKY